jgi:long-chain acyl-CoA synthetase
LVRTVSELFYKALGHDLPDALACREGGRFHAISHREVQALVERLALALEARGLRRGDRLALLSENRPEWAVTDYACAITGIVSVPVYPTLNPSQTAHILRDSRCRWAVCSTPEQLAKILEIWAQLPHLEGAVLMGGPLPPGGDSRVEHWSALQEEGRDREHLRAELRARAQDIRPQDLLTLIYTSGTTGDPKGAMLTHGNVASNVLAGLSVLQTFPGERILSILPLSHIFERTGGHYVMFHSGVAIYYAESLQTIPRDLQEVRPHLLLAVPRIFEKAYGRVREQVNGGGLFPRLVFHWAMALGRRRAPYLYRDLRPPLALRLAGALFEALVFSKVRETFGGRLRLAVCGGAPIHPRILEFFWASGIPVFEGYGLTETSPILTLSARGEVRPGFVGRPVMDTWEGAPFLVLGEDGEILARGPNVMAGYWENEEATRAVMDENGYFHTGDIGEMDEAGRLRITDRKKEILVTSGGKNVAPQPIENALRADKYIEQAVLVGDKRNYIAALIVPKFPELRRWARHRKLAFSSDAELAALPQAVDKVMRRVERINAQFSNYERVRKVALLDRELTPDNGMLTPSLKVRRRAVNEAYARIIDSLYQDEAGLQE